MSSSALFDALETHDLREVANLLAEGADPDELRAEWPRWRPLHAAINELEDGGPLGAIILLIRHQADVNAWDADHDSTPLLMASLRGDMAACQILLASGADPAVKGAEGDTPLCCWVERGDRTVVLLLLLCGAEHTIDLPCGLSGVTALGKAAQRLDIPMIKLLLECGADRDALDSDRRTARERLPRGEGERTRAHADASSLLGSA